MSVVPVISKHRCINYCRVNKDYSNSMKTYVYLSVKCTLLLVHVTELDNYLTNSVHSIIIRDGTVMHVLTL